MIYRLANNYILYAYFYNIVNFQILEFKIVFPNRCRNSNLILEYQHI
jgi:hypothetical protein